MKGEKMNEHPTEFRNVRFLAGPVHAGFPSPADDWREKRLISTIWLFRSPEFTQIWKRHIQYQVPASTWPGSLIVANESELSTPQAFHLSVELTARIFFAAL
jgi:hypothetical protein